MIVFINQFFWPDESATSQILTDLLGFCDHSARVICGRSTYVGGESRGTYENENVTISRIGTYRFGRQNTQKVMSYAGFYVGAVWLSLTGPRPSTVVTMTTPPLLGLIGWALQRIRGCRHVIWEMDVYPDVATAVGEFKRGGMVERAVGWLADIPRRRADLVISLGPCMTERLVERGVRRERIREVDNWANGREIRPKPFVADGRVKILYSGNAGLAHEFVTVCGAVERLAKSDREFGSRYAFRFSGGGRRSRMLREWATGRFENVVFGEHTPRADLGDALGWCDVGLVTQISATCGAVVPSKAYGILAAGRPIVFVGPRQATVARIIAENGVGWQVDPGDVDGLVERLRWLRASREDVELTGTRAREVFTQRYDMPIGVAKIARHIGLAVKPDLATPEHRASALVEGAMNGPADARWG